MTSRGTGGSDVQAEVDLEEMFKRVLASQQPFFTGLLNQIAAMETRQHSIDQLTQSNHTTIQLLLAKEYGTELAELQDRMKLLEDARQTQVGVMVAVRWIPQVTMYLTLLVGAIMAYFTLSPPKQH